VDTFLRRVGIYGIALAVLVVTFLLWRQHVARGQVVAQTFLFTWTGDDGNVGTASSLELRWSKTAIAGIDTLSWWNAATKWAGAYPVPKVAGTPDSVIVLGLPNDTVIYAIAKVCDEVPNCSGFSNVAVGKTKDFVPPTPLGNLRFGALLERLFRPGAALAAEWAPPAAIGDLRMRDEKPIDRLAARRV